MPVISLLYHIKSDVFCPLKQPKCVLLTAATEGGNLKESKWISSLYFMRVSVSRRGTIQLHRDLVTILHVRK